MLHGNRLFCFLIVRVAGLHLHLSDPSVPSAASGSAREHRRRPDTCALLHPDSYWCLAKCWIIIELRWTRSHLLSRWLHHFTSTVKAMRWQPG